MATRTLYFGNPAYLSTSLEQMVIKLPQVENNPKMNTLLKNEAVRKVPIEDIGVVILDHQQITITHALIAKLMEANVAMVTCDASHHPTGLMLNLSGHTLQSAKFRAQIRATEPLKKQLWQQTVAQKIRNQATHLKMRSQNHENLMKWSREVRSGDSENHEARAATYYWKNIFAGIANCTVNEVFKREREGMPPNNLLNYGYSILRAIVARSLVGSGLLPTLGIFHRNQYNAYCLADDVMEPYRPFVDKAVYDILANGNEIDELSNALKTQLLSIPHMDVLLNGDRYPLFVAIERTTASLAKCFEGKQKKLLYPELIGGKD
jgi:CRISPR-associated protein Cas1